jgi:hypothetical protein
MKISSEVEVCNLALLRINQSPISSLSDDSLQASACKQIFQQSKSALLSQYNWTFAIDRAILQIVTDNSRRPNETDRQYELRRDKTLFEYVRKFALPAEFLRLISVYNSFGERLCSVSGIKRPYVMEGMFILSDQKELKIKYIKDINAITQFSPLFIDCFVLDLALRLTKFFNDSSAYLQQLQLDYAMQMEKAKISDCQQTMMDGVLSYPLLGESRSF